MMAKTTFLSQPHSGQKAERNFLKLDTAKGFDARQAPYRTEEPKPARRCKCSWHLSCTGTKNAKEGAGNQAEAAVCHGSLIRYKSEKDKQVQDALCDRFLFVKSRNTPVNCPVLCQKTDQLAKERGHFEFKATDRCFNRLKKRHGITFVTLKGETAKADVKLAKTLVNKSVSKLLKTFREENIYSRMLMR